jgi:hypothetical protein
LVAEILQRLVAAHSGCRPVDRQVLLAEAEGERDALIGAHRQGSP